MVDMGDKAPKFYTFRTASLAVSSPIFIKWEIDLPTTPFVGATVPAFFIV